MKIKIILAVVVVVLLLPVLLLALLSLFSRKPGNLGVHDGELRPCPDSPNCVSSRAADDAHRVQPLAYAGPAPDAWRRLEEILRGLPRARITERTAEYMYVEFTSALFRFTDDVEFQLDEQAGVVHVRSASRAGHSDLGANRSRVEQVRRLFTPPDALDGG